MSVYQVLTNPNESLRVKAAPVKKINDGVLRVLDNMKETLYAEDGLGLAAPQIGVPKRIVVIDPGENLIELINPEIVWTQGEQVQSEGCLSVPNTSGMVNRAFKVKVKALNRQGEEYEMEAEDLLARALQHEIDHLDGILFIDRAIDIRKKTYARDRK